ncbi:MAG: c-type cytochrome [Desertimonas sp.]
MIALTTTTLAWIVGVVILLGWLLYALLNIGSARPELGSEVELAANRKPYYDDEILEGRRLTMVQFFAVVLLAVIVIALPLYWILEPGRQTGATDGRDNRFVSWGSSLFATTADGGFNCAGCHGGMGATGGVAEYTVTDPVTGEVQSVQWVAPALNTAAYRFDRDELTYIITYGRPGSPMSAWGLDGSGPLNSQQVRSLVDYIVDIQVPREDCGEGEAEAEFNGDKICESGHLPDEMQAEIQASAQASVDDGTYATLGEALFNNPLASGAYSCARCHTEGWSYGDPGVSGQGALGWNLTGGSANRHFTTEADLIEFLRTGTVDGQRYGNQGQGSGRMPSFGSMLTDDQIEAIAEYVRSL